MSLFPAYSDTVGTQESKNKVEEQTQVNKDKNWLENSSYQEISKSLFHIENEIWTDSSETEEEDDNSAATNAKDVKEEKSGCSKSTVSQKNENNHRSSHSNKNITNNDLFFIDVDRNKMFFSLNKLERGLKPNYKLSNNKLGFKFRKPRKHKNFQRYHVANLDNPKKTKKDSKIKSNDSAGDLSEPVLLSNLEVEDSKKVIVEEFNKKLNENPNDIQAWIEYATFQDQIHSKNLGQVTKQKQLSIIEKGLAANHNSIELLKMKLSIMAKLLPADEFCQQVETMIQKDQKNIILWQALIKMKQTSCALCQVSGILDMYVKCFAILKQRSKQNPKHYDYQVLQLLFECLIFLRHAGLWEQMWEIIRINLCLNLPMDHDTLKSINTIDEKVLINMEELVLTSKLPLSQLWLRIESLRESCHWTSVDLKKVDISLIGDEKRLVSAEETIDFIYPTISKESSFRLIVFSLLSLKVPLLPSRHCVIKDLQLTDSWSIDSLESLLPMIYSTIWKDELANHFCDKSVIVDLLEGKLIPGPQLLKFHPAQDSFLEFIRLVFHTVAEKLPTHQRTSILIWWLRLERLLVTVAKSDALCDTKRNKKLKSTIKSFLKKPENRNNLLFYCEFALIEYELGSLESCIQILKTIILSQDYKTLSSEEKAALFCLYRTMFEILLMPNSAEDFKSEIFKDVVKNFKVYVATCFNYDTNMSIEEMLYNEILRFLMNPAGDEFEDEFLLPNICCDILICYSYLLHNKSNNNENVNDILDLFDRCLVHCQGCERLQERLYETKVTFIQFYNIRVKNMKSILINTVQQALDKYSCNFLFLATNALFESELPFWKWKTKSAKLNIWSIFASCLAGRARIVHLRNIGLSDTYKATINKMLAFHNAVSKNEEVQHCPLLWKLYMLLIQEHNLSEKKGEDIYYEAVSQCPWARSVYISAAEIAPQNLPQIQDLIKEKGLRMHVTLEELEILRE